MSLPRLLVLIVTVLSCAFGQRYAVSTFAGSLILRPDSFASNAPIGSPVGVAMDRSGNLYFASWNCIFRMDPSGNVNRVAGNYSAAQLSWPTQYAGMAVDRSGAVYFPMGNAIWKIFPNGAPTQVATQSPLHDPTHVAVDANGNLYVSESLGGRIDKISPVGAVTQYAGGGQGSPVSGGTATGVFLSQPNGLAIDGAGNLYFVDNGYGRVFKVATDGTLSTVAGTGTGANTYGYSGDNGPATSAYLDYPTEVAVDGNGNVFIASQGNHIRKVTPDGIITTLAGNGDWGYSGDGGTGAAAPVVPHGLATDSAGNLYIADFGSNRIRKVTPGGTISTVAGDGTYGFFSGDGGAGLDAQLSLPGAVALDKTGNLYIADIGNNRVRKIGADGTITTVAGNGEPGYAGDGGPATKAQIIPTGGLAVDSVGNIYIRDAHGLRKITADGIINTLPGTIPQIPGATPPPGTAAAYAISIGLGPRNGLAADGAGDIYTEGWPATGVDQIAPDGSISFVLSDHYYPGAIAAYGSSNLYWYSGYESQLYSVTPTNIFTPLASLGSGCAFLAPIVEADWTALAADSAGNLYAAMNTTAGLPVIRKFLPSGASYLLSLAGVGAPFHIDTIAVDSFGNIFGSDAANDVIHLLKPMPAAVTITSVTNAASNLTGAIAPGEIIVITGQNLGPSELTQCLYGSAGLINQQLNGTQVLFNGSAAPVLYTSATQVATVAPGSFASGSAQVSVVYQGQASASASVPVASSTPALFTLDATGKGQAAAVNLDGTINGPSSPAKAGSYISLYATGGGQNLPVTVNIGGQTMAPQFAGQAPGYLAGLMQVNVLISPNVTAGNAVPVSILIGGVSSQPGVTIAIAAQ